MANFLSGLNYQFKLAKLPTTEFLVQRVILPGLVLGTAPQPTPFSRLVNPGEIQFSDFSISFKIDENLNSVFEIYDWMEALGRPESYDQYLSDVSDASLIILNSTGRGILDFTFTDCYPSSIAPLTFETTTPDVPYLSCDVSFSFNRVRRNRITA